MFDKAFFESLALMLVVGIGSFSIILWILPEMIEWVALFCIPKIIEISMLRGVDHYLELTA